MGDEYFRSRHFLQAARTAEATPGSPAHREFATTVARLRGDRDYLDLLSDLTDTLTGLFEEAHVPYKIAVSSIRAIAPYIVGSAWWADIGYPSISLTHDFQRAVLVTDFGDAGEEPMHMPFPAFVVRLPETLRGEPRAAPLFIYPVPTVVEGVADFRSYRMTLSPDPGDDDGERQAFTQWDKGMSFTDFLGDRVRSMEQLDVIERQVTTALQSEIDPEMTKRARRILGNTLLYINGNGGLPPSKMTGEDVAVEREHSIAPRFRVGRPIKLGPQIKEAVRVGLGGGASWKLLSRFMVRGFFRNQPYGPQHSLRRRQWIEPYWKGPETVTEALERTFEVT